MDILGRLTCGYSDKQCTLTGRVVSKVSATRAIVVDHDEIPGFMAAMTMPIQWQMASIYRELNLRIRADIVVKPDGQYSLDRISLTDPVTVKKRQ